MNKETENLVPVCTKEASTIQAIDKKSVHRICSGQVVLTLATAVKELVENSIDAGATSVEVKLKDYGSESIEVIDNGCGIEEKNFEGVTLKHHTSKLQDFEDLINVSTFGFRGEALSSLCALSNVTMVTRHKAVNVGTRLEFDVNGKITQQKSVPRQVGTTLTVQNIFYTLPVRHKEFQRNLKKEFARLIQVLNAYCIINTGVRISCTNQTSKGSRSTVVSTNGNITMRDNITNVFGPKQLLSLLEFKQVEGKEEIFSEFGIKPQTQSSVNFKIDGFISKCEHGQGRSTSDRQFLFINKRPCDATKIFKVINEVYHSYNRHQNPFVALQIQINKECVDVNVTPDKRQIFVDGEKVLLAVLKSSLIEIFEPTTSVYKLNNTFSPSSSLSFSSSTPSSCRIQEHVPSSCPPLSRTHDSQTPGMTLSSSLSNLKRSFSSAFDKNKNLPFSPVSLKDTKRSKTFLFSSPSPSLIDSKAKPDVNANSMLKFVSSFSKKESSNSDSRTVECGTPNSISLQSDSEELATVSDYENNANKSPLPGNKVSTQRLELSENVETISEYDSVSEKGNGNIYEVETLSLDNDYDNKCSDMTDKPDFDEEVIDIEADHLKEGKVHSSSNDINTVSSVSITMQEGSDEADENSSNAFQDVMMAEKQNAGLRERVQITDKDIIEDQEHHTRKEVTVKFSLSNLKSRIQKKSEATSASQSFSRSFRAKICPGDNQSAEDELSREISKDMFVKMKILGQFNLGFIITQLGSDLFIVDQHATDEKYNFEMLQRNTVLQSQRLIIPQSLELTASNETILVDNLEIFKKNGFNFIIEPEAPPTQRVKLVSAPVSKNWNFGKDDIEELLFMLTDSPDVMCRPSRVRMMFASRACRKSIMIGTALNHPEMKRVVNHMGEIEQPWNCPHGRPTMRHLFNMKMLPQ